MDEARVNLGGLHHAREGAIPPYLHAGQEISGSLDELP